jgi:calcineurin-like phosphoesterase
MLLQLYFTGTGCLNPIRLFVVDLSGHASVVKVLLANGAEVNLKNLDGKTALDLATERGHRKVKELLADARHGTAGTVRFTAETPLFVINDK